MGPFRFQAVSNHEFRVISTYSTRYEFTNQARDRNDLNLTSKKSFIFML